MPAPFRFDQRFHFGLPPEELWHVLTRTERYPEWWSWLRRLDADGFARGSTAHAVIQAPLPFALRVTGEVQDLVAPELVATRVSGDLHGPARLEIRRVPDGSEARLTWALELRDPVLRRLALVARPAMAWAHDRVVGVGVGQFRQHLRTGRLS